MKIVKLQNCDMKLVFGAKTFEGGASDFHVGEKANQPEYQQAIGKRVVALTGERSLWFTKKAEPLVLPIRDTLEEISKGYNVNIDLKGDNSAYKVAVSAIPKRTKNPIKTFFNWALGAKNQFVSKEIFVDDGSTIFESAIKTLKEAIAEHDSRIEYTRLNKLLRK